MNRLFPRVILPALKWSALVLATAAVVTTVTTVTTLNVYADNDSQSLQVLPMEPTSVAAIAPINKPGLQPWAPSAGFADLIEHVSPAVVHVSTSGFVERSGSRNGRNFQFPPGWEDFFRDFQNPRGNQDESEDDQPQSKQKRPLGIGSGFVISADGYVVTNHHVIDRADEIVVAMTNGDEYQAQIIGSDPKTDLALLKLDDASDLPFVVWGDDEKSRVGDWVVAIGNPFGLGGSASTGIISARGRDIRSGPYDDYIQVDAAINRGNSGGPLFNTRGEVIGINTAIYSPNGGSVGIGFSIPATMAKGVVRQLQESGSVERGWIGVGIQEMDKDLANSLGRDNDSGALITAVEEGAPASKAGLQVGDIILEFDGHAIEEMRDLPRVVAQASVGGNYRLSIWRDGDLKNLTIKTEPFPDELAGTSATPTPEESTESNLIDAQLKLLSDYERREYGIDSSISGVLVESVERNGLAARNGLRRGDVIVQVDSKAMTSAQAVTDTLSSAKDAGRSKVSMLLNRGGNSRFLAFSLED